MRMDAKRIEKWIWPLIYGGLLLLSLGLFVGRRTDGTGMGWALVLVGLAGVVAGAVLVVLRSRLPDKTEIPPES